MERTYLCHPHTKIRIINETSVHGWLRRRFSEIRLLQDSPVFVTTSYPDNVPHVSEYQTVRATCCDLSPTVVSKPNSRNGNGSSPWHDYQRYHPSDDRLVWEGVVEREIQRSQDSVCCIVRYDSGMRAWHAVEMRKNEFQGGKSPSAGGTHPYDSF